MIESSLDILNPYYQNVFNNCQQKENDKSLSSMTIPYVTGLPENVRPILRKYKIWTSFNNQNVNVLLHNISLKSNTTMAHWPLKTVFTVLNVDVIGSILVI